VPYSIVCQGTNREFATGQIFIDDDNQPTMEITSGRASYIKLEGIRTDGHYALRSSVTRPEYVTDQKLMLNSISVLGVQSQPFSVRVNGHLAAVQVKVDVNASLMELSNLNLPMGEEFELVWNTIPNGSSAHAR
jgi:alpha-D-xyloside xylohydrolase